MADLVNRLYLFEIYVDKIVFQPEYSHLRASDMQIHLLCGDLKSTIIESAKSQAAPKYDLRDHESDFKAGKSVIFSSQLEIVIPLLGEHLIMYLVDKKTETSLGFAEIIWQYKYVELMVNLEITKAVQHNCSYEFKDRDENVIAVATTYLCITDYGQTIEKDFYSFSSHVNIPRIKGTTMATDKTTEIETWKPVFMTPHKEKHSIMDPELKIYAEMAGITMESDKYETLTPEYISNKICGHKHCPGAVKFKDLGIGPLATAGGGRGVVNPNRNCKAYGAYGLSQAYGTADYYGAYGLFVKPKKKPKSFCDSPNCPFKKLHEALAGTSRDDKEKDDKPFCACCQKPTETKWPDSCGSPYCPSSRKKKICDSPDCPKAAASKPKPLICKDPMCEAAAPKPPEICDDSECSAVKKKETTCGGPSCPFSEEEKVTCKNEACPGMFPRQAGGADHFDDSDHQTCSHTKTSTKYQSSVCPYCSEQNLPTHEQRFYSFPSENLPGKRKAFLGTNKKDISRQLSNFWFFCTRTNKLYPPKSVGQTTPTQVDSISERQICQLIKNEIRRAIPEETGDKTQNVTDDSELDSGIFPPEVCDDSEYSDEKKKETTCGEPSCPFSGEEKFTCKNEACPGMFPRQAGGADHFDDSDHQTCSHTKTSTKYQSSVCPYCSEQNLPTHEQRVYPFPSENLTGKRKAFLGTNKKDISRQLSNFWFFCTRTNKLYPPKCGGQTTPTQMDSISERQICQLIKNEIRRAIPEETGDKTQNVTDDSELDSGISLQKAGGKNSDDSSSSSSKSVEQYQTPTNRRSDRHICKSPRNTPLFEKPSKISKRSLKNSQKDLHVCTCSKNKLTFENQAVILTENVGKFPRQSAGTDIFDDYNYQSLKTYDNELYSRRILRQKAEENSSNDSTSSPSKAVEQYQTPANRRSGRHICKYPKNKPLFEEPVSVLPENVRRFPRQSAGADNFNDCDYQPLRICKRSLKNSQRDLHVCTCSKNKLAFENRSVVLAENLRKFPHQSAGTDKFDNCNYQSLRTYNNELYSRRISRQKAGENSSDVSTSSPSKALKQYHTSTNCRSDRHICKCPKNKPVFEKPVSVPPGTVGRFLRLSAGADDFNDCDYQPSRISKQSMNNSQRDLHVCTCSKNKLAFENRPVVLANNLGMCSPLKAVEQYQTPSNRRSDRYICKCPKTKPLFEEPVSVLPGTLRRFPRQSAGADNFNDSDYPPSRISKRSLKNSQRDLHVCTCSKNKLAFENRSVVLAENLGKFPRQSAGADKFDDYNYQSLSTIKKSQLLKLPRNSMHIYTCSKKEEVFGSLSSLRSSENLGRFSRQSARADSIKYYNYHQNPKTNLNVCTCLRGERVFGKISSSILPENLGRFSRQSAGADNSENCGEKSCPASGRTRSQSPTNRGCDKQSCPEARKETRRSRSESPEEKCEGKELCPFFSKRSTYGSPPQTLDSGQGFQFSTTLTAHTGPFALSQGAGKFPCPTPPNSDCAGQVCPVLTKPPADPNCGGQVCPFSITGPVSDVRKTSFKSDLPSSKPTKRHTCGNKECYYYESPEIEEEREEEGEENCDGPLCPFEKKARKSDKRLSILIAEDGQQLVVKSDAQGKIIRGSLCSAKQGVTKNFISTLSLTEESDMYMWLGQLAGSKQRSHSMNNYYDMENDERRWSTDVQAGDMKRRDIIPPAKKKKNSWDPCTKETCNVFRYKTCSECGGLSRSGATCDNTNVSFSTISYDDLMDNVSPAPEEEGEGVVVKKPPKQIKDAADTASEKSKPNAVDKTIVSKKSSVMDKPKKKKRSRFVYVGGEDYPGIRIGHKICVTPDKNIIPPPKNVPGNMGWLWNIKPEGRLWIRHGWRPGVLGKTIKQRVLARRKQLGIPNPPELKMLVGKKKKTFKYAVDEEEEESDEEVLPKPTLIIQKKEGSYLITMNPLKDPKKLADNENPYMDCKPLQFVITKKKPSPPLDLVPLYGEEEGEGESSAEFRDYCLCDKDSEISESSSSDSELNIEFTTPAGLIIPERMKRLPNVVHTDTQFKNEDFTCDDCPTIIPKIFKKDKKKVKIRK